MNELGGYFLFRYKLQALEDASNSLATTNAGGYHAVAFVTTLHFVEQLDGQFCTGTPEGVTEGNGATVHVYDVGVQSCFLNNGQGLSAKGFV